MQAPSLIEILKARSDSISIESSPSGRRGVSRSSEFRRIAALPRRDWIHYPDLSIIDDYLRKPGGWMSLWQVQRAAIYDVVMSGGAFLPIGVGRGKAPISLLVPVALEAKRPILFVPAQLRDQTISKVIPEMSKHWKLHPDLEVRGYSELSLVKHADMLDQRKPDLIVLDEAHMVRNPKAGRTRRLIRYLRENPQTKVVAMSGTISNRSLKDWAHLAVWSLGVDRAPVPSGFREISEWADCLDEGVPEQNRLAPGALQLFCNDGENVRQGFRRRLVETPGVVATAETDLKVSLRISKLTFDVPPKVREVIERTKQIWQLPDGQTFAEATDLYRHLRTLALGFWYRWDPPPPKEWANARKAWHQYVRHTLRHNRRGLDTELQVWNECKANHGPIAWIDWMVIRDSYTPKRVAAWIDSFAIHKAARWLEKTEGICWTEQTEFGKQIALNSGARFYGAGDDHIVDASGPIIASMRAHGTGKNLQQWNRNLVTCPPSSGQAWEQLLGRTHRHGQQADEVETEFFGHTLELLSAFERACDDARYLEDTYGNRQKLCYADLIL